jgi:dihydroorotase
MVIIKPDDWHVHLRDGKYLATTVPASAKFFGRILVMPNLQPPLTQVNDILSYRERILKHMPEKTSCTPYMTLYLTDKTSKADIQAAKQSQVILSAKLYPAGITTNAAQGVTDITKLFPVFESLSHEKMILNIHGEDHDPKTDIFDREQKFLDLYLAPIIKAFPDLKIVLEHISTRHAVDFVLSANANLAATITPQHLLYQRNDLLSGGIKPHYYCLPILKRHDDQQALIKAATSGNPKFFLGTDSAPHAKHLKENACGCAGIFTAPIALALYAEVFASVNAMDKLENFTSVFGADFYNLPHNQETITLINEPFHVPEKIAYDENWLVPLKAGQTLSWSVQ